MDRGLYKPVKVNPKGPLQLAEAEKEVRTVVAGLERLLGPDNPETLTSRHILGVVFKP